MRSRDFHVVSESWEFMLSGTSSRSADVPGACQVHPQARDDGPARTYSRYVVAFFLFSICIICDRPSMLSTLSSSSSRPHHAHRALPLLFLSRFSVPPCFLPPCASAAPFPPFLTARTLTRASLRRQGSQPRSRSADRRAAREVAQADDGDDLPCVSPLFDVFSRTLPSAFISRALLADCILVHDVCLQIPRARPRCCPSIRAVWSTLL